MKLENKDEIDFWKAIYLAYIAAGSSQQFPYMVADRAVENLRASLLPDFGNCLDDKGVTK